MMSLCIYVFLIAIHRWKCILSRWR